jgi:hypothetical protein
LILLAAPAPEIISFLSILNIRFITGAFGALAIAAGATGAEVVGARVIGDYVIGAKVYSLLNIFNDFFMVLPSWLTVT